MQLTDKLADFISDLLVFSVECQCHELVVPLKKLRKNVYLERAFVVVEDFGHVAPALVDNIHQFFETGQILDGTDWISDHGREELIHTLVIIVVQQVAKHLGMLSQSPQQVHTQELVIHLSLLVTLHDQAKELECGFAEFFVTGRVDTLY